MYLRMVSSPGRSTVSVGLTVFEMERRLYKSPSIDSREHAKTDEGIT